MPRPENIARAANHRRQRLRPKDPQDLEFELATDHIPSEFLARAKSWYINATFKLCRRPFSKLMTVNAFVRKDDHAKQVLLLFMLMSGHKKSDYRKVFEELIEILLSVPKVQLHGCVFHWMQALWRKVR